MPLQVLYAEPRYATRFSWVYLGESAIAGSVSTVAARAFASLLGPPLPGRWSNLHTPPDLWAAWGSFGLLIITAVCSLILQNKAMIHFGNSEVGGPARQHYTTPTAGHGLTSPRPLPTDTAISSSPGGRWCRSIFVSSRRDRCSAPPLHTRSAAATRLIVSRLYLSRLFIRRTG